MSKLEVDKIDPQSGTALEIGTSGDTVTIPSGVTLDASNATTSLPATVVTTTGTQTLTNKSIATTQLTGTITPSDNTVSLAKLTASGTKSSSTFLRGDNTFAEAGGGITEADMFRLTADVTSNGVITSNLERVDNTSYAKIGTGMSESSGIFTFPSTGLYLVRFLMGGQAASDDNILGYINTTTNNSDYADDAVAYISGDGSTYGTSSGSTEYFFNVTNTSTHKVKFTLVSIGGGSQINGNTSQNLTCFTFIRLGDSQ